MPIPRPITTSAAPTPIPAFAPVLRPFLGVVGAGCGAGVRRTSALTLVVPIWPEVWEDGDDEDVDNDG
jgi:hypothetical protein